MAAPAAGWATPSGTAELVCFFRALDLQWDKENSIIKDEYARLFLSDKMWQRLPGYANPGKRDRYRRLMMYLFDWIILRYAEIDNVVRKYALRMPVVLLGAGYDSRSLRLKSFLKYGISEVDFPATAEQKKKILAREQIDTTHITFYSADLMQKGVANILTALNLKGKQALIVWEGVTMYIPRSEAFAKVFKSEPILFGSDPEGIRTLALAQGAKSVASLTGNDIAAKFGRSADFTDNGMFALAEIGF